MTNDMQCQVFQERLMAYLEDETDAPTRAAIERHAGTCGECGPILADLRKLRIDAANLPELAPSRDLWSGIAERIEAPVVPIGHTGAWTPARRGRAWKAGLMAASLVGATALGYFAGHRTGDPMPLVVAQSDTVMVPVADTVVLSAATPSVVASREPTSAPAGIEATPAAVSNGPVASRASVSSQRVVAALTADYDKEIRQLGALLESRRNQMDPATVAVIERNLQVIDAAITESRLAILRDPASRFLIESLNQSLQMKVELMRTAAMLPSRT